MRKATHILGIVAAIARRFLSSARGFPCPTTKRYRFIWAISRLSRHILLQPHKLIRASSEDLTKFGYDVQRFPDNARSLVPDKLAEMPEKWKHPPEAIAPEVAILRHAILFDQGWVILPSPPTPNRLEHQGVFTNYGCNRYPERLLNLDHEIFLDRINSKILRHKRLTAVPGRCFSARTDSFNNFGKFVNDLLTKIYYEEIGVIAPGREKIIDPLFKFPIQKILFDEIFAGYEIVRAQPSVALAVEELVMPSNLRSVRKFNAEAVAYLSRRMDRILTNYARAEKLKVCVSRRDGNNKKRGRDFINYESFYELARDKGYLVVEVSALDPYEQLTLWANTTHLLGVHGAGMMNMIMMPTGGTYIEIANPANVNGYTKKIESAHPFIAYSAMAAGHKVLGVESMRDQQGRPVIDLRSVERILREAE